VDPNDGVPLGVQIVRQVRLAVSAGRLREGDRLPAARELAAQLGVNFHTVRKAYADLAAEGLLEVGQGRGTFVTASGDGLRARELRALVREHVRRLAEDLAGSGVPEPEVESIVVEELRRALAAEARGEAGRSEEKP
jgi:DNA-binding transcriptional regulator YhcF (GntR family)